LELDLQTLLGELTPEEREGHAKVLLLRKQIEEERTSLARPMFTLNMDSRVKDAKLVVIDECSMVDGRMGEDLLSFKTKVLVLGDPAQLPPVGGAGFFTEGITPDVMLTDIHRQARDNPIIAMATKVRNQEQLELGSYGNSEVIERAQVNEKDARNADQILVGRNNTRHASNKRMRSMLARSEDLPEHGDKLVCLRNNNDMGLLNGAIWYVKDNGPVNDDKMYLELLPERDGEPDHEAIPLECEAHTHYFTGNGEKLAWYEKKDAQEFDYGYALTVHKSQGSQWNNVLLFDESYVFRADRWRWLYTGITRAAERVTLVLM
jgi:exodeoxyribonuclease V